MKVAVNFRLIGYTLHMLIWGGLLMLPYFVSDAANGYRIGNLPGVFFTETVFINMAIFYANALWLYPKLYNKSYWWLYIISSILIITGSVQLKFYTIMLWFPLMMKLTAIYRYVYAPSVVVFAISIIYRRIIDNIRTDREQKEKQAEQLSTELKFLRSQISPHFLFNTLTNLVSLARKKSDHLEESLIMLSDLIRYMLYDTQGKKVELSKEVNYLNSYIKLQKLRFGNNIQVDYSVELGDKVTGYAIEPMLLIPFVENAFKHGTGYLEYSYIYIRLAVKQGSLIFEVQNKFDANVETSKDESSGIGLANVKTRLDMLYKNNYSLTINNIDNLFGIILILKLV